MASITNLTPSEQFVQGQLGYLIERDSVNRCIIFRLCNGRRAVLDGFQTVEQMDQEFKPFKETLKRSTQWYVIKDYYIEKHRFYVNLSNLKEFTVLIRERAFIHCVNMKVSENRGFNISTKILPPHLLTREFIKLFCATQSLLPQNNGPKISLINRRVSKATVCLKRKRDS